MTITRNRVRGALISVAFSALLLSLRWYWGHVWQKITITPDVTHITSPLRDDGTIDYIAAINEHYGKDVTAKNNAAILLYEICLSANADYQPIMAQLAAALNAPELTATRSAASCFVNYQDFRKQRLGHQADEDVQDQWSDEIRELSKTPWKTSDHPEAAAWLGANEAVLAQVESASHLPHYFVPELVKNDRTIMLSASIGSVGYIRELSDALATRATRQIAQGDLSAARQDAGTILRLGQLLGNQPTILERLVAIAMMNQAFALYGDILAAPPLTGELATQVQHDLSLSSIPSPVACIDEHERFVSLDLITLISRYGPDAAGSDDVPLSRANSFSFGWMPLHFDAALRLTNVWVDRLVAAAAEMDFAARESKLKSIYTDAHAALATLGTSNIDSASRLSLMSLDRDRGTLRLFSFAEYSHDLLNIAATASTTFAARPPSEADIQNWTDSLPANPFTGKRLVVTRRQHLLTLMCEGPEPLPPPKSEGFVFSKQNQKPPTRRDIQYNIYIP